MIETINTILRPLEKILNKYRTYFSITIIILSFLGLYHTRTLTWEKESGEQALNVLWIILWLPIFARVFQIDLAKSLMWLRKELGILMGALAFIHSGIYLVPYFSQLSTKWFWIMNGTLSYMAFWFFALILTIPLVLTSNNWSMRILWKRWKTLHRTVYLIVIFTVIHVVLLKSYKHFEIVPVITLCLYFLFKILEWKGISFGTKKTISVVKCQKWICVPCWYIYDPVVGDEDSGIKPGTEFVDIPDDWTCPLCGVKKSDFVPYNEDENEATSIAIVQWVKMMNPTTIELEIETEEEHRSEPWQFMSFLWQDEAWQFPRSYSIARQEGKRFTFLIKLTKWWRWAECIKKLEAWDVIRIRCIAGQFILKNTTDEKIFIATGTGLAPIYRMILAMNTLLPNVKKSLYFTVSTKEDLFYVENLRWIENLDLHIHVSREEVEGFTFWRVDVDAIESSNNAEWYLCGNPAMVKEAREKLMKKWQKTVLSEEFS